MGAFKLLKQQLRRTPSNTSWFTTSWLPLFEKSKPHLTTYQCTQLVQTIYQSRQRLSYDQVKYLHHAITDSFPMDPVLGTVLIKLFFRSNAQTTQMNQLWSTFTVFDTGLYNIWLSECMTRGWVDSALDRYKSLCENKEISPDARTFTILFKGLKQQAKSLKDSHSILVRLWDDVLRFRADNTLQVDVLLLTAYMNVCVTLKYYADALKVYRDMIIDGQVVPDVYCLSVAVHACGGLKAVDIGFQLVDHAEREFGLKRDAILITQLIESSILTGVPHQAIQTFQSFQEHHQVFHDVRLCNACLRACAATFDQSDFAESLFRSMNAPDAWSANHLLLSLCRHQKSPRALAWWYKISTEYPKLAKVYCFETVIMGLYKQKHWFGVVHAAKRWHAWQEISQQTKSRILESCQRRLAFPGGHQEVETIVIKCRDIPAEST